MLEIFIDKILAIFTNGCESGECDWMLFSHARSFPFVCIRPHWVRRLLAPLTGRFDVLGVGSCLFWETRFLFYSRISPSSGWQR
jgi:hypothetical protein